MHSIHPHLKPQLKGKKMLSIKSLSFALLALTTTSLYAAPFTPEQEERIKEIVRESVTSDPSILSQAIVNLQTYQEQHQVNQLTQAIKKHAKQLFDDPNSPRMGAQKPLINMVVFTDYNCPYCKRFTPLLERIVKENPEVALTIKFLPFKGDTSIQSSADAIAIWQKSPEKFWALDHILVNKQAMLTKKDIENAKAKVGASDINNNQSHIALLKKNFEIASELDIKGTPFTIIGNAVLPGAVSYDELDKIIKMQLKQAKK